MYNLEFIRNASFNQLLLFMIATETLKPNTKENRDQIKTVAWLLKERSEK